MKITYFLFARYEFAIRNGILSEFVIRQAIANCLNMGYGLQIRSQRGFLVKSIFA